MQRAGLPILVKKEADLSLLQQQTPNLLRTERMGQTWVGNWLRALAMEYILGARGGKASSRAARGGWQEGYFCSRSSRLGCAAMMWVAYSCLPPLELSSNSALCSSGSVQCSPRIRSRDFLYGPEQCFNCL